MLKPNLPFLLLLLMFLLVLGYFISLPYKLRSIEIKPYFENDGALYQTNLIVYDQRNEKSEIRLLLNVIPPSLEEGRAFPALSLVGFTVKESLVIRNCIG